MRKKINQNKGLKKFIIIFILLIIMSQIIRYPKQSISSAKEGLDLWLYVLLPSLLPFIFISNLLISFGFVKILGRCLEPLMKPLFNVSGIGIFPFSMSIMSGYPMGAKLTSQLKKGNKINVYEANRLISFSSTSGPLFILGTVAIGMLGQTKIAPLMIIPHYLGAITIGLLFRFYKMKEKPDNKKQEEVDEEKSIGFLIASAIKDSMDSMLIIGGFLIVYSVIIDILLGSSLFNSIIIIVAKYTTFDANLIKGTVAGIIELTKGCDIISKLDTDLINKILIINFLIGWGGLSIHSQAISFISSTNISTKIYLISKLFHGILSCFYTYLIYSVSYKDKLSTTIFNNSLNYVSNPNINNWLPLLTSSIKISFSLVLFMLLLSIFIYELRRTY